MKQTTRVKAKLEDDLFIEVSPIQEANTVAIYNITVTLANTEYSQALPSNAKKFTFQCRTAYDIRFAFVTGKVATPTEPYMTLKAGMVYYDDMVKSSATLYVGSSQAGVVLELVVWT